MDGYVTIGTKIDTSGIESGLTRIESKLDKSSKNAGKKFGTGFLLGFSLLTSIIGKLLESFANSVDGAIKRVDTLNNFPRVMESLGQSSEDAQKSVDYLSDKLTGLPTTLDSAVSAVQRFTSANNNVKASTEMFLAFNNALLAGGAPMELQKAALEQLSQAYGRQRMEMQEWRTLMTAMPGQLNQVAEVMGLGKNSADKLGQALRNGDISMNDFMTTLVKMNNTGLGGFKSLEEQARTGSAGIQTSIANLKTAIVRGWAEVLQTIGQTNITNFFNTIINGIKAVIPYIAALVKSFMVAVTFIGKAIGTISGAIGKLFGRKSGGGAKQLNADLSSSALSMKSLGTGAGTANKNLGKAAKSAKEIKKQLAGFDEMNVLQDNTSASTGGGAGGGTAGGIDAGSIGDLGDLGNFDTGLGNIGNKIKEITPLMKLFTSLVWGLIAAFSAFKIMNTVNEMFELGKSMVWIIQKAAGIGLIVGGIVLVIQGVISYLQDPTWQNFLLILGGIGLIVAGIALAIGPIPALITGIVLLIGAIGLAVYKNWDKIKAVLSKVGSWVKDNIIDPVVDFFKGLWESIKEIFAPVIAFFKPIFEAIIAIILVVIQTIINYVKTVATNIKTTIDNIKQIIGLIVGFVKDKILTPIVDNITTRINTLKSKISAFVTAIKNYFSPLINFFSNIINKIKGFLVKIGTAVGNTIAGAFKGVVNGILNAIEKILNFPINAVNKLINKVNTLPGVHLTKLTTFKFPRLAKGGIVNNPGPGVMVGSAIAGERGAEGVIPLTDSQQMALLGEAIGRYITVNANITNNMNGRVISRELQKIQNDDNFAYNR